MSRPSWFAALLVAAIAGCAAPPLTAPPLASPSTAPPAPRCAAGTGAPMLVFELFFGLAVAGRGDVTDREWTAFVERVVTPAVPNGFTVLDADGAWMSPTRRVTVHERSKLLLVALPDDPASLAAVTTIRTAYQTQFHQQLVGMIVQPACAAF